MFKICTVAIFYFLVVTWGIQASEYPTEFQIRQEPSMRTFIVSDGTQFLGAVLNSSYGQFDFYDKNKIKICINREDKLFDPSDNMLGFIEWKKDAEAEKWFWQRRNCFAPFKTHMILYTTVGTPILTLDEECEGNCFVFREYETQQPLAVACWSWESLGNCCIAAFDLQVQHWNVMIVDRPLLEEKRISFVSLVWLLVKHSQLNFPELRFYPYDKVLKE